MTGQYWMRIQEKERGQFPRVKVSYTAIPCMHCDNPACLKVAANGAIYRRPDGIIMIDPQKAAGHKELVSACPYRVIYWNEEKGTPQKCSMCAHLLDRGYKEPRCVEACPTGALTFGDLDDKNSPVARLVASGKTTAIHPEYGLREKVQYIGLPAKFIAGAVILGDTDECAENVVVTLLGEGIKQTIQTNNYGDFEFEGLESDKQYRISVAATGYQVQEREVVTRQDIYLGDIVLAKSEPQTQAVKK
jgi:Fe-S-cluster-containing dehydrogenase component